TTSNRPRSSAKLPALALRSATPEPPGPPGIANTVPMRRCAPVAGSRPTVSSIVRPAGSAQFTGTSIEAQRISRTSFSPSQSPQASVEPGPEGAAATAGTAETRTVTATPTTSILTRCPTGEITTVPAVSAATTYATSSPAADAGGRIPPP